MDNVKTTKFINGETVSYAISAFISVFSLFTLKQILKVFVGISPAVSIIIGFICAEILSYLLEKRFVFRKRVLSSNLKQIFLFIFRAVVNFGFYQLSDFLFGNLLNMEDSFVWLVTLSICFFFNYFFDRLILFDCAYYAVSVKYSRIYKAFYKNRYIAFSSMFTLLCLLIIFIGYSCFPFGDYSIMRMDLYHQYGPLFAELYDRVVEHKSIIYSWYSGGGSSFLGNYFNYLSSPLTILIFLFDREDISQAITFLVLVKCALSAGAFTAYLKCSQNKSNYFSALFGVLYAFSAYFLAYYWNVMWLDGMILLPIIALGIEKIINEEKCSLYIFSLALLLLSSYYMGFMTCIFSVIYFLGYMVISSDDQHKNAVRPKTTKEKFSFKYLMKNRFFNRAVNFGISSIIAGGISAFALVPIYFILTSSSATSGNFPQTFESYFDIFDFITSHLAGLETTIRSSGNDVLPNVYSGIIVILLLPLYVINKDIKLKEKFVYIVMLIFFLFSFDNNIMNYLWHAMHFPNDLPFRFSYMYSFLILVIAYKALSKIKSLNIKDICFTAMAWIFFICVAQKMSTEKMSETTIYLSIALIIIWCGFLYYYLSRIGNKKFMSFLAIILVFVEVIVADIGAFQIGQTNSSYKENYADYTEAIQKIHENDNSLYREELSYLNLRMDPCYYGYNGMSTFSSMAYEKYSGLQYNLGMFGNRINSYTYNPQTAVYNMMFGIKYLIKTSDETDLNENLYEYCFTTDENSTDIYKFKYYLPIAYCASNELENWVAEEGNPFEVQSDYFELATGYSGVFNTVDYLDTEFDNINGSDITENGNYWFYNDSEDSYGKVTFNIVPIYSGNLYVYISSPDIVSVDFNSDNSTTITQDISEPYILDLGYFKAGNEVSITLDCQNLDSNETYADIYAYTLNQEIFEKGYDKLKATQLEITDYSETRIVGTVEAYENCYLYTSIPYDKGWTITVDGEESETFSIGNDSMLTTALKPGKHNIIISYEPVGINYGLIISAVSILGFCFFIFSKKRKNNDVLREFDNNNISYV